MIMRPARSEPGFFTGTSRMTSWLVPLAAPSGPFTSMRSMKIMRRLQSLAPPEVATSVSQPAGSSLWTAASLTAKSSCRRVSALLSTNVSAATCRTSKADAASAITSPKLPRLVIAFLLHLRCGLQI